MLIRILIRLALAVALDLSAAAMMAYAVWCKTVSRTDPGNAVAWAIGLICLAAVLIPSAESISALMQWAADRKRQVSTV